jgi:hypothetical protein
MYEIYIDLVRSFVLDITVKKDKDKVHPRTGHEGPERE